MEKQSFAHPLNQVIKNARLTNGHSKAKADLSEREIEVFQLVADGYSNKQIAGELKITDDTVDTHNRNIVGKLKAKNMKEAVAIGIRNKIIK